MKNIAKMDTGSFGGIRRLLRNVTTIQNRNVHVYKEVYIYIYICNILLLVSVLHIICIDTICGTRKGEPERACANI